MPKPLRMPSTSASYTIGARDTELALDYCASWDAGRLASWLTMALDQRDWWHSSHSALLEFNRRVVTDLLERRGLVLGNLARGCYLLKRAVEQRIRAPRLAATERGQATLFALPDDVVVTPDAAFEFDPLVNPATSFYEGAWTPTRCYYSHMGKMNGDELECAQAIDTMPAVRHWVHNGDHGQHAFSLPVPGGNFFPDFVADWAMENCWSSSTKERTWRAIRASRKRIWLVAIGHCGAAAGADL